MVTITASQLDQRCKRLQTDYENSYDVHRKMRFLRKRGSGYDAIKLVNAEARRNSMLLNWYNYATVINRHQLNGAKLDQIVPVAPFNLLWIYGDYGTFVIVPTFYSDIDRWRIYHPTEGSKENAINLAETYMERNGWQICRKQHIRTLMYKFQFPCNVKVPEYINTLIDYMATHSQLPHYSALERYKERETFNHGER